MGYVVVWKFLFAEIMPMFAVFKIHALWF